MAQILRSFKNSLSFWVLRVWRFKRRWHRFPLISYPWRGGAAGDRQFEYRQVMMP